MKLRTLSIPSQWALLGAAILFVSSPTTARDNGPGWLDQEKIHSEYNEGDFDKVVIILETFMSTHKTYTFQDSVFIAKHLAVVYTANPNTREKGKYYMFRLLTLLPSAKLVDMFVSDEIDRIFEKVRDEFFIRQHGFGVDSARIAVPERAPTGTHGNAGSSYAPPPAVKPTRRKESHTGLWIAGGATIAAAGLALTYFLIQVEPSPAPEDRVFSSPRN